MGDTISRLRTPNSATLPGGSRKNGNLSAHGLNPEKHSPGVLEEELQASLQDDVTRQLGHKGVPCWELPHGHAHPLPEYGGARRAAGQQLTLEQADQELLQADMPTDTEEVKGA